MLLYRIFIILINFQGIIQRQVQQQTRIVGGSPAKIENFPYHLAVFYNNQPLCGGALLSTTIGISAAHCFAHNGHYSAHLGSTFLTNYRNIQRHIYKVIVHPKYNRVVQDYDVALLFLNQPVRFTRFVQPIRLPSRTLPEIGEKANITGWGYIDEFVPMMVQQLRTTQVRIFSQKVCKRIYSNFVVTARMFCAGYPYRDSCQGDSGGALVINGTIFGVISWGVGCGDPNYPGVYTNITAVRDFIRIYSGL